MKLAMVCPYALDRWGGVQNQAIELSRRLSERGVEITLVGPGEEGPVGARVVGRATGIPFNRSVAPIGLGLTTPSRVRKAVADADLVHVHEPLVPLVSLAALLGPVPAVGTFHAAPGGSAGATLTIARPLLRRLANRLVTATAVSEVAAQIPRRLGIRPAIVPNAIDADAYLLDMPRAPHRVVFLGRDEPRKGLGVLLAAWPDVRRTVPGAELVVVGSSRTDPPDGVRYLGSVEEDRKRLELARASVLAAPNTGEESFGVVVVEAMAGGCAVVASDIPGFREAVGDAGLLVAPGRPDRLAGALTALLTDEERTHQLSLWGRARARSFDWSTVIPRYLDIYREAMT